MNFKYSEHLKRYNNTSFQSHTVASLNMRVIYYHYLPETCSWDISV